LLNYLMMRTLPRNLFARDYLQEHSPTMSGFKAVWDNIDSETKRVRVHSVRFRQGAEVILEI
jgi:hypothetical protein